MKKTILSLLLVLTGLSSCIFEKPEEFELKPGDSLPSFSVEMTDGTLVTSEQLGKGPALIMFFHTGCPDCQNTLPSVQKLYDEYRNGVAFVLISREQGRDDIDGYWKEKGYTMPYSPQSGRDVYNLFATSRVPRVYVCKDGKIKSCYHDDPIPQYEDLLTDLQSVL